MRRQRPAAGRGIVRSRSAREVLPTVVGMDAAHAELRFWVNDLRQDKTLREIAPNVGAARTRLDGGYLLEARMPWAVLGIEPKAGAEAAFQLYVARKQADGKLSHAIWYPWTGATFDPHYLHRIRPAD